MPSEARDPLVDFVLDLVHGQLVGPLGPHLLLLGRKESRLGGRPLRPPLINPLAGALEEEVSGSKKVKKNQVLGHNLFFHKQIKLCVSIINVHSKVNIKLSCLAVNRVKCSPVYTIKSYKTDALRYNHKKECQCHKINRNFTR